MGFITFKECLEANARRSPGGTALSIKTLQGQWQNMSWENLSRQASLARQGLSRLGLLQNRGLAIMAPNSEKWEVLFYACMLNNSFVVGVDPHLTTEQKIHLLNHSQVEILAVQNEQLLNQIPRSQLEKIRSIVILEPSADQKNSTTYTSFQELLESSPVEENALSCSPDAPALLIYTSGTTGLPKGLLYSQRQVLETVYRLAPEFKAPPSGHRFVSWLPVSNLFQRIINVWALTTCSPLSIVADPSQVLSQLREIRATIFIAIPRFFERITDEVEAAVAKRPQWFQPIVRAIAKRKVRQLFGGQLRNIISGSAPLGSQVRDFFESINLSILEAYGVSESVLPIAMNLPANHKSGSVGKVLEGNEIRQTEDGEILLRGPGVVPSYYRSSDRSRWTEDGFYRTGDFGYLDQEGFLYLQGRADDLIKTSSGRRVSLLAIEARLKTIKAFDQVVVVGHGRKQLTALVTLHQGSGPIDLERLKAGIAQLNSQQPQHEQVRCFLILREPLSVANGHFTANLKIRRAAIENIFAPAVENLMAEYQRRELNWTGAAAPILIAHEYGQAPPPPAPRPRRGLKHRLLSTIRGAIPSTLRNHLARRMLNLPAQYPLGFKFELVQNMADLKAALTLLHDSYVQSGFMDPALGGVRITPYHCISSTTVIVAKSAGRVVGTVSLIRDSYLGFPMDKIFDLTQQRQGGRRLVEVSSLAIDPNFRATSGFILHGLFRYLFFYARDYLDADNLVITVNPKMAGLYEAFYEFTPLSARPVRSYDFVKKAPAVGLTFDIPTAESKFKRLYEGQSPKRNIHEFFFNRMGQESQFPKRTTPHLNDMAASSETLRLMINWGVSFEKLWTYEERLMIAKASRFEPGVVSVLLGNECPNHNLAQSEPRFDVHCKIWFADHKAQIVQGSVRDISKDGLRIHLKDAQILENLGPIIRFRIEVGPNHVIFGKGRLVWRGVDGFAGVAIEDIAPSWHELIEQIKMRRELSSHSFVRSPA